MSDNVDEKKNERLKAAALKYDADNDVAPVVVAVGKGAVAERIISTARESDVPVVEDSGLANMLNKMKIGEQIPPQLYSVVAQILVFISDMDQRYKYTKP